MDIRNVGNQGKVERAGERTKQADARTVVIPSVARDEANISSIGRETAAAIAGLARRARNSDGSREALVASAVQKLNRGELDSDATLSATARRLLDANFHTV